MSKTFPQFVVAMCMTMVLSSVSAQEVPAPTQVKPDQVSKQKIKLQQMVGVIEKIDAKQQQITVVPRQNQIQVQQTQKDAKDAARVFVVDEKSQIIKRSAKGQPGKVKTKPSTETAKPQQQQVKPSAQQTQKPRPLEDTPTTSQDNPKPQPAQQDEKPTPKQKPAKEKPAPNPDASKEKPAPVQQPTKEKPAPVNQTGKMKPKQQVNETQAKLSQLKVGQTVIVFYSAKQANHAAKVRIVKQAQAQTEQKR